MTFSTAFCLLHQKWLFPRVGMRIEKVPIIQTAYLIGQRCRVDPVTHPKVPDTPAHCHTGGQPAVSRRLSVRSPDQSRVNCGYAHAYTWVLRYNQRQRKTVFSTNGYQ